MIERAYFLLYNHHMKTITKLRDKASHNILATLIIGLATMLFLLYEILGYRNFTWTVLDLGLFNRHMWSLARFSIATNPLKGINLLSDHAHFILIFLTPLYWIIPNPTLLLMTQAVCIGVSGIPIYKIARRHNSRNIAAMWLLPYYLYFGFWDMLGYPFHEVALAVPLLAWSLWFLLSKNYRWLILTLGLLALVKEDMPLVLIMFGLYIIFIHKKWKFGAGIIVTSTAYFFLLMDYWFPVMNHGTYIYGDTVFGHGMGSVLRALFLRPIAFVKAIFTPVIKLKTMLDMLLSFGLVLPLASVEFLIIIPLWVDRFLSDQAWRWCPIEHYSADQGPILAVAAIIGTANILRRVKRRKDLLTIAAICLCIIGGIFANISSKPRYIAYLFKVSYYQQSDTVKSAWHAVDLIPSDASVGVQSAFPQLTSRRDVYNLPIDLNKVHPSYLVLSSKLDYWPFQNQAAVIDYINQAKSMGYIVTYNQNQVYVLKHK